tara:strand:- start:19538 stop:21007 length:1470 start_codon:yes stop_codon:yes gene_type:complete
MIEFGEWLPDQSDLGNGGVLEAKNVLPGIRGYKPMQSPAALSNAADNYIRGIFSTRKQDRTVSIFAGDSSKIYKFNAGNSNLDNVSTSGNYSLGTRDIWKFVKFGDSIIAASGHNQALQEFNAESSSNFDPISGAPAAKHIAVVRDFVVTGNVKYSGNTHSDRIYFSALNDPTDWTIGTNQTDIQTIPDAGHITAVVGGQYGIVLLERAIARLEYVGSPIIFSVEKIETNHGCELANSVAALGTYAIFYYSPDGFFMFDGNRSIPIGAEKVDQFFQDDLNPALTDRLSCAIDPRNQVVMWSYASNSSNGDPDRMLAYNYAVQKWSLIETAHEFVGQTLVPGTTLEGLDNISSSIDSLETTLDSPIYEGESFILACSKDKKIATFTGSTLNASITSREFEIAPLRSSLINNVTPYITSKNPAVQPTVSLSVGSRQKQVDDVSFTSASTLNADNVCNVRAQGRYHRVKLDTTGDFRYALGVDVEGQALGRR